MQSLVTNSVGAVCAAVTVPRLRSMKGFRSGVCNVAVPGTDCHAGQGQGRLGRNRDGWRQGVYGATGLSRWAGNAHFCTDSRRMCSWLILCVTTLAIVGVRRALRKQCAARPLTLDQALMGMHKI